jgi:signal peptidase I
MEPTTLPPAPAPTPMNDASKRGWKNIASTIAILLIAPLMAVFITIFVFQSYEVYGMSMETTLQDGDRLIVQKLSKNWSAIRGKEYIPQRYEIVVFDKPSFIGGSTSGEVDHLIKRVIGLPGERVVARDGKYTIYNVDNPEGFDPDSGMEYAKDITTTPGEVDITVSEGEIFVSGDNRTNSLDSRNFGAINADTVTGIATIRFVPVNAFKNLTP